ncbi:MAG: exonuclease [Desulfobacteraceae bacterium]|nr:exonuclease [Desulfobacteraceae bacterium]
MNSTTFNNPFLISRVDNPFQNHPDIKSIHENEFKTLCQAISEIKKDTNSQSRAITIIGAPGCGKTHLAMRLANEILFSNRLLFIRQPNNRDSVYLHIYTRILESMVENVPGTPYSQLAYLLGKSFSAIIINQIKNKENLSLKDKSILEILQADPMNIYKKIGGEGTETRRRNWKYIENITLQWWESNYGLGGHSKDILKGFIKYCSYTDPKRKHLIYRWLNFLDISEQEAGLTGLMPHKENDMHEEFALDAMIVISRLSLADEPLVIIFDQLEGLKYNEDLLFKFFESVKELFTHLPNSLFIFNLFSDRWENWQKILDPSITDRLSQSVIHLQAPDFTKKIQILEIRAQEAGFSLENFFSEDELRVITNNYSIRSMLVSASNHFRHKTGSLPLADTYESFEEKIENQIKELKQEISQLKKYLNISLPTFREVIESESIDFFIEEKKQELLKEKTEKRVYSETDDAGKILVIINLFKGKIITETGRLKAGARKLPEHVLIKGSRNDIIAGFLHMSGNSLTGRLKNLYTLCINNPLTDFYIFRNFSSSPVKSKIAKETLAKLKELNNFKFRLISEKERLEFEIIYELITAIQNKDIEGDPIFALKITRNKFSSLFLFQLLESAEIAL